MNRNFVISTDRFDRAYPGETYALAVSGGADSMALLYWMKELGFPIVALTIDHKLRPESAAEARHVADVCKALGVKHEILEWTGDKPRTGLEEAARRARYALLLDYCKKNNIGVLMTAHQADDQIETFLMNLGRGSGLYGLAGIREETMRDGVIIFRPLLSVMRKELQDYCDKGGIRYFNDAMNQDESFLRVRVRKNRHILSEKLDISDARILLAIKNMGRLRDYVENEAKALARELSKKNPIEFQAAILLNAPDEIRFRALSVMLAKDYPPRLNDIANAFAKLDTSSAKFTLAGCNIRILAGKIRIWKEGTKWPK